MQQLPQPLKSSLKDRIIGCSYTCPLDLHRLVRKQGSLIGTTSAIRPQAGGEEDPGSIAQLLAAVAGGNSAGEFSETARLWTFTKG